LADRLGRPIDQGQSDMLDRFRQWLIEEAMPAGGIGPNERRRLDSRHLIDSLLFSRCLNDPALVWDLGSGVGLPGIPLAVIMPATRFVLIDRSDRRVDMMKRAIRVLSLDNVITETADINDLEGVTDAIVSRASLSVVELAGLAERHLEAGGVAVVGGSWSAEPHFPGWRTLDVGSDVLDRPVWIFMMRRA
jgi:16S rRNA (guanine527-N7)-methyltransferase